MALNSRGVSEFKMLSECKDTITIHLESCHLSKSCLTEEELILRRAGFFDVADCQVEKMWVCPKHRHNLGRFWRSPRSCKYPSHSGPRKKQCKDRHVIGLAMAKDIQDLYKVVIGIGSREYNIIL